VLCALGLRWGQAVLVGFNGGALTFALSLGGLFSLHSHRKMRDAARANDTNRLSVLALTSLLMLVIVTAVLVDLPMARVAGTPMRAWSLALVLASLVIAWLFSNLIWALHYAHMYYGENGDGGLIFPQPHALAENVPQPAPNLWDFTYFAMAIGMAFATSDTNITRSDFRRMATVHGTISFFYNLIVLAFTINVTAGS